MSALTAPVTVNSVMLDVDLAPICVASIVVVPVTLPATVNESALSEAKSASTEIVPPPSKFPLSESARVALSAKDAVAPAETTTVSTFEIVPVIVDVPLVKRSVSVPSPKSRLPERVPPPSNSTVSLLRPRITVPVTVALLPCSFSVSAPRSVVTVPAMLAPVATVIAAFLAWYPFIRMAFRPACPMLAPEAAVIVAPPPAILMAARVEPAAPRTSPETVTVEVEESGTLMSIPLRPPITSSAAKMVWLPTFVLVMLIPSPDAPPPVTVPVVLMLTASCVVWTRMPCPACPVTAPALMSMSLPEAEPLVIRTSIPSCPPETAAPVKLFPVPVPTTMSILEGWAPPEMLALIASPAPVAVTAPVASILILPRLDAEMPPLTPVTVATLTSMSPTVAFVAIVLTTRTPASSVEEPVAVTVPVAVTFIGPVDSSST